MLRTSVTRGLKQRLSPPCVVALEHQATFLPRLQRSGVVKSFSPPPSTSRAFATLSRPFTQLGGTRDKAGEPRVLGESALADHSWRQNNHIWSEVELDEMLASKDMKHTPETLSDRCMSAIMKGLYHTFNTITGYEPENPVTKSIEWRLIVLESFAGVPGFMAAAFRHFHSLRSLQRDHGAIFTLLEEAENERMHLLVCLKMFEASPVTRALVVAAQVTMVPFLAAVYMVKPQAMHRFVGYLEETAVHTYANILKNVDTPGTHLHRDWYHLPAPDIAINYWNLEPSPCPKGGMEYVRWYDTLRHILADEAHHRDVNHTYAELQDGEENPFVEEHMRNFDAAVARRAPQLMKRALLASSSSSENETNPGLAK